MIDDPMDAQLSALDPSRREAPPAPGSVRYASILERAMSGTDTLPPISLTDPPRRAQHWRPYLGAVAAAGLVGVVASAALLRGGAGDPDPVSAVSSAAETTAEITSLRATLVKETGLSVTAGTIEVDGDRAHIETTGTPREGGEGEDETTIIIGGDVYILRQDGETGTFTNPEPLDPFGSSSQAVVTAALSAEAVEVVGQEAVRGAPSTHYRITLDDAARDALDALEPGQRFWFDLGDPEQVRAVDVWVGGDLIRRLRVEADTATSTVEYFDFGADIDIERPGWAGPHDG